MKITVVTSNQLRYLVIPSFVEVRDRSQTINRRELLILGKLISEGQSLVQNPITEI